MVMCFAPTCKHYSEKHLCKFLVFPREPKELKKWINLIRRKDRDPSKHSLICSCHFINGDRKNGPAIFSYNIGKQFETDESKPKRQRKRAIDIDEAGKQSDSSRFIRNAAIKRQRIDISDLRSASSISDTSTNLINTLYLENEIYERNADVPSASISINDHSYSLAKWLCVTVSQATQTLPTRIKVPGTPEEIKLKKEIEVLVCTLQRREKQLKNLQDVLKRLSQQPLSFDNLLEVSSSKNRNKKKRGRR